MFQAIYAIAPLFYTPGTPANQYTGQNGCCRQHGKFSVKNLANVSTNHTVMYIIKVPISCTITVELKYMFDKPIVLSLIHILAIFFSTSCG